MDCEEAVIEFQKGERSWIQRETLIQSLRTLAEHSGGNWPVLARDSIDEAIDALIGRREVVQSPYGLRWHNTLFVTPAVAEKRPVQRKPKAPVSGNQGTLF